MSGTGAIGYEQLAAAFEVSEDFAEPLGPEWTVDIPAGGTSTVTVADGILTVVAPVDQIDSSEDARGLAPFVYRDLPADVINYEIVTKFESTTRGHIGLVLFDAATERSILQVEYQRRSNFRMIGPKGDRLGSDRDSNEDVGYLKLERLGTAQTWNSYYKLAGRRPMDHDRFGDRFVRRYGADRGRQNWNPGEYDVR